MPCGQADGLVKFNLTKMSVQGLEGGAVSGDRRCGPRTPCFIPVHYESPRLSVDAFATNVGPAGLLMESSVQDERGACGELVFEHYLLPAPVSVGCTVASLQPNGMGLAFRGKLPPDLAGVVRRFCPQADQPRILMVDDEREILRMLDTWLDHEGMHFVGIQSPFRSVEGILRYRPDLVVLDVRMPGMNGVELCKLLRATPSLGRMKILLYAAMPEADLRALAAEAKADAWLSKGARPSQLVARVEELLGEVRAPDAAAACPAGPPSGQGPRRGSA